MYMYMYKSTIKGGGEERTIHKSGVDVADASTVQPPMPRRCLAAMAAIHDRPETNTQTPDDYMIMNGIDVDSTLAYPGHGARARCPRARSALQAMGMIDSLRRVRPFTRAR